VIKRGASERETRRRTGREWPLAGEATFEKCMRRGFTGK
jgi:hypothetical protein